MPVDLTLAGRTQSDRITEVLRSKLPVLAMAASRGGAVGLQLLVQIVVGALSGPAGLGLLQLFNSWTCIGGEVMARGLPARTMRITSVAWENGDVSRCRAQLNKAASIILRASVPVTMVATSVLLVLLVTGWEEPADGLILVVSTVIIAAPVFALLRLGSEGLKALDGALQAVSLENLVAPAVILLVCLFFWLAPETLNPVWLLCSAVAGFVVTAAALWLAINRRLLLRVEDAPSSAETTTPSGELRALWFNSVLSILFMHLPFVILPWFASATEIGVFAVAFKLINVITTLLILMAAVFGPAFARAAAANEVDRLGGLLWRTQYLSLAVFLPLMVVLLVSGDFLSDLFNLPAQSLLPFVLALSAGQLINAATGLPGVLLNMVGAAHRELYTLIATLIFIAILAPFIGTNYGALGIAWLLSASLALKNIASFCAARYYLKHWIKVQ